MKQKNIVVVGGGTGTYTVLTGLKHYPVRLAAIVSMADDGGSNKVIRDEFGLLPTSDIRQCIVALSETNGESERLMRELFNYRFHRGEGVKGMTFGNLFMAALADILGSQAAAIKKTGQILKIRGNVIPVTLNDSKLGAKYENGQKVISEHLIDEPEHDGTLKIQEVFLEPPSKANPEAVEAILKADLIILGPGDLYTSIIPNLLVQGIPEALKKTKARIVYILNLMTKPGQSYGLSAKDHISATEKYLQRTLDVVIANSSEIPQSILEKYKEDKSFPVKYDFDKKAHFKIIRKDIISKEEIQKTKGDLLKRSFVRHDSPKLAKAIMSLLS